MVEGDPKFDNLTPFTKVQSNSLTRTKTVETEEIPEKVNKFETRIQFSEGSSLRFKFRFK